MKFTVNAAPQEAELQQIRSGIIAHNLQFVGDAAHDPLAVFCDDTEGRRIGGITGDTFGQWLRINFLWLEPSARGAGLGSGLLRAIEAAALARGCRYAQVDTFSFQARPFYEAHGYRVQMTLHDYPLRHQRHYLSKTLEPIDQLYHDPELAQFYDAENDWSDGQEYCRRLAHEAESVLDLGCGSGLFAATLAQAGHRAVTGADPATPMLDIARTRPGGDQVRWLQADARTLRLDERFDLIVLTGHAFQVFLTRADQAAVLRTIAHHLRPGGRFIFDSRNPLVEEWREWTPALSHRTLTHPQLGQVEAWNDVSQDTVSGVVSYDSYYRVSASGKRYSARSPIAFPSQGRLAELIETAGLAATSWLGDWDGRPCSADAPEIIVTGTLRA